MPSCHHNQMTPRDHMRYASTPLWWSLRKLEKLITLGLNREGQNKNIVAKDGLPIGVKK